MELATYDLLPTDDLFPIVFNIKNLKPINERFEYLDFISNNFLMNMGSMFVVWLFMCLQIIFHLVGTYTPLLKEKACCKKLTKWVSGGIFWGSFIEFLMQAYLEIGFAVAI